MDVHAFSADRERQSQQGLHKIICFRQWPWTDRIFHINLEKKSLNFPHQFGKKKFKIILLVVILFSLRENTAGSLLWLPFLHDPSYIRINLQWMVKA